MALLVPIPNPWAWRHRRTAARLEDGAGLSEAGCRESRPIGVRPSLVAPGAGLAGATRAHSDSLHVAVPERRARSRINTDAAAAACLPPQVRRSLQPC